MALDKNRKSWEMMKDYSHLVIDYWDISTEEEWQQFNKAAQDLLKKYNYDDFLRGMIKEYAWRLNSMCQGIVDRE